MMEITSSGEKVPGIRGINGITGGSIYIARRDAAGELTPDLPDGVPVVLSTREGRLELTTRHKIQGSANEEGTYLSPTDLASLADRASPTIRRYTRTDTFAKLWSCAGIGLLLPAVLGILAAVAGLVFLLLSPAQSAAPSTRDSAAIAWAAVPGNARSIKALSCIERIEGQPAPAVTIPGVSCAPPATHWWRSPTFGAVVVAVIALITAGAAIINLPARYRHGRTPSSS